MKDEPDGRRYRKSTTRNQYVKYASMAAYRRAVEIGELGHPSYIANEIQRCAAIEGAVMELVRDLLGNKL